MNAIAQLVGDKDITLRLLLEQEPDDVRALALLGSLIETLAKAGFDNSLGLLGFWTKGVQIVHPLSPEATDRAVASTNDFASQGQFNTFKTLLDRLRVLESGAVHQGESVTVLGKCTTFLKSQMLEVFLRWPIFADNLQFIASLQNLMGYVGNAGGDTKAFTDEVRSKFSSIEPERTLCFMRALRDGPSRLIGSRFDLSRFFIAGIVKRGSTPERDYELARMLACLVEASPQAIKLLLPHAEKLGEISRSVERLRGHLQGLRFQPILNLSCTIGQDENNILVQGRLNLPWPMSPDQVVRDQIREERVGEIERAISVWRVETCCSAKVLLSVVDSYRTPVNGTELQKVIE
ncbi:MAG: hypothetical protein AAB447_01025 [Patescibacteria group bacterium]